MQYVVGLIDELPCESLAASQRAVPANYTLAIPEVTAKNDNPIIVPITVNNTENLTAGGLSVVYNPSVLRVVKITPEPLLNGAYWKSNVIEETGEIRFAFAMFHQESRTLSSPLMQIKFESLRDVEGITTDLIIEKAQIAKGLSIKTIDGSITFLPTHSALLQNYPNPFNPDTWIPYQLAEDATVTIRIYNAQGHLIRTLYLGLKRAGIYMTKDKAFYWDGKDSLGQQVASGLYFYNLQAGEFSATKRMLVLK